MARIVLRCELVNIVKNYDGTTTYYFKDNEKTLNALMYNMQKVIDCAEKSTNGLKLEICKWTEQRSSVLFRKA